MRIGTAKRAGNDTKIHLSESELVAPHNRSGGRSGRSHGNGATVAGPNAESQPHRDFNAIGDVRAVRLSDAYPPAFAVHALSRGHPGGDV